MPGPLGSVHPMEDHSSRAEMAGWLFARATRGPFPPKSDQLQLTRSFSSTWQMRPSARRQSESTHNTPDSQDG